MPLETHEQYFFKLNTCGYSPYVTSSLTRGWICRLQLLLALASAVVLESDSRGAHGHILLSYSRRPQPGGPGPRIYFPPEQGGPVILQALGSFFVASYYSQGYGGGISQLQCSANCLQDNTSARTTDKENPLLLKRVDRTIA
jgi:hypothetical protein